MELKLEEGEVICNKCKGTGLVGIPEWDEIKSMCPKCFGAGKTDWVTNAMGVIPNEYLAGTSASAIYSTSGDEINIVQQMIQSASEEFAKQIDDEILSSMNIPSDLL